MSAGKLLRLIAFRSSADSAVLDAALRERLLPEIGRLPGVDLLHVARRAPTVSGERILVSVRTESPRDPDPLPSEEANALARLGAPLVEPSLIVEERLLPIAFSVEVQRPEPARILRVYRGNVRPGQLDEYIRRAEDGTRADAASVGGLCSLYLATGRPERFITVSTWLDWGSIEQATGGDVRRPMATRHSELIAEGEASHFEIVQTAGPAQPSSGGRD